MNSNNSIIKVPHPPTVIPSRSEVDISPGVGTYMVKILTETGLHKFEPEALGIVAALIDSYKLDRFCDVGANIGVFSWCMKAIFGDSLDVRSYEPLPSLAQIMHNICSFNELDVDVRTEALSDKDGQASFYISAKTDTSSSLAKGFRPAREEILVDTLRMTTAFEDYKPKVIKIDTETTEPEVLRGGESYIAKERPHLVIEVLAGRSEEALTDFCERQNYIAYKLNREELKPTNEIIGDSTYQYRDWLFSPAELSFSEEFKENYNIWTRAFSGEQ